MSEEYDSSPWTSRITSDKSNLTILIEMNADGIKFISKRSPVEFQYLSEMIDKRVNEMLKYILEARNV